MMSASTDASAPTGEYIYMDLNTGDWGLWSDLRSFVMTLSKRDRLAQDSNPRAVVDYVLEGGVDVWVFSEFDDCHSYVNVRTGVWAAIADEVVDFEVTPEEMEMLKNYSPKQRINFGGAKTFRDYYDD